VTSERIVERSARVLLVVTGAILVLFALRSTRNMPAPAALEHAWSPVIEALVSFTLLLRALSGQGERRAWFALSAGVASFCGGDLYYTLVLAHRSAVPFPSIADGLYAGFYAGCLLALGLLVRSRVGVFSASVWLDAILGSLAVGAVGAALVFPAVLSSTGGDVGTVVTNLAFPLADLLLLSVVVGGIALMGWRPGRGFALIAAALCLFAVTDSTYLYQTALDTYQSGTLLDTGWEAALFLLALAAWQPARRVVRRLEGWVLLVAPLTFGVISLGVTTYDHFARVDTTALLLATAALLTVLIRLGLTFAEHLRTLADTQAESLTDVLTGLGNRRALMRDLDDAAQRAQSGRPVVFVLFDLDGFKGYNDRFGHPAGDGLLARLGARLREVVGPDATAYRLGGDEFCILTASGAPDRDLVVARARAALSEQGDEFAVTASFGRVLIPAEAAAADDVLREADRRLYRHKNDGRASASRQGSALLLRALEAHHAAVGRPDTVAALAQAVARRLRLSDDVVAEIAHAAELHDIGKLGIPAAILERRGLLSAEEMQLVRRHTLIGQRILDAAPALSAAGRLVRSAHERWDGMGYPDGLVGEEIPLGSRIIFACAAFDAMSRSEADPVAGRYHAVAELERCSGSQFDPEVVSALAAAVAVTAELSAAA
jgi:diguanylate cyclase (GGDEF)-like protein